MKKAIYILSGLLIIILTGCADIFGAYLNPLDPDNAIKVTKVSLSKDTAVLVSGETLQLLCTITPENATNKGVVWSSSDAQTVSVSAAGLATAVKPGSAEITAKSADGGASAVCKVTVECVITFNSKGGSEVKAQRTAKGAAIVKPENPVREDYGFTGWYKEESCENAWNFEENTVETDTLLYAGWLINSYSIVYHLNDGVNHAENPGSYTKETEDIILKSPTKEGYIFNGWYEKEDFSGIQTAKISKGSEGNVELWAKWSAVAYSITYYPNGGGITGTDPVSYTAETDTIVLSKPVKSGYVFGGWYGSADFSGGVIETIPKGSSGNIALYAKWGNYSITYIMNGGNNNPNPLAYNIDSETIVLTSPEKTGYAFAGWYDNSGFIEPAVTAISKGSSGNKTLYAKWRDFTIAYTMNGGSFTGSYPQSYNGFTETITLTNPEKTGYIFGGWFDNVDFTGGVIDTISKGSSGDKTLYAKFLKLYTITYELDGGTNNAFNPSFYTVETDTITLLNPIKDGYEFKGWYEDSSLTGNVITTITKGSGGDKPLYAKFLKFYTITYEINGGTNNAFNPSFYTVETDTITLTNPSRDGYVSGGWYDNSGFSGSEVKTIIKGSSGDKTLYAKWEDFTITYNLNGGTNNGSNPSKYNGDSENIDLNSPVKDGFVFGGWYDNPSFTGTEVTTISKGSSGNKVLYAKWHFYLTFNKNGGNGEMNNQLIESGKETRLNKNTYTRENYTFIGWAVSQSDASSGKPSYGDCGLYSAVQGGTLYAVWRPISGLFTTQDDGSGGVKITSYDGRYNPSIVFLQIPNTIGGKSVTSINGYAFQGCMYLKSITIPSSLSSIGYTVFAQCSSLESVIISSGVTSIGEYAFADCTNLKSVTIPSSVTSISSSAFYSCSSLEGLTIGEGNPKYMSYSNCIYTYHYYNMYEDMYYDVNWFFIPQGLKSMTIYPTYERIDVYSFPEMPNITSLTIPSSVYQIDQAALNKCSSLETISIDEEHPYYMSYGNCIYVENGTILYYAPKGLKSVNIPSTVTSIGGGVFGACDKLTNLSISSNNPYYKSENNCIYSISGDKLVCAAGSITSMTIPSGVTTIGLSAFQNSSKLISVIIPDSVTSIEDLAFDHCTELISVTIFRTTPPTIQESAFWYNKDPDQRVFYVPAGSVDAYKAAGGGWTRYKDRIQAIP